MIFLFRQPSPALAGMGLMVVAVLCSAIVNLCYRAAMRDGLPVPLVPFVRGVITLFFLLPWILRIGPMQALSTRRPLMHLARGGAGIAAFSLQLVAILWLPLADAVAMVSARPLWVLPLAALLLHEKVRKDKAIAAAIGFAGVLLIAQPGAEISIGTPAGLAAGLCSALVLICFRALSSTEPPARVVALYAVLSVVIWGPVSAWVWQTPSLFALTMLVIGTVFAVISDLFASAAARQAEVGLLAPIEYIQIPASGLLAWAIYAEQPGSALLAGTLAMLGATLYLARRAP